MFCRVVQDMHFQVLGDYGHLALCVPASPQQLPHIDIIVCESSTAGFEGDNTEASVCCNDCNDPGPEETCLNLL